MSKGKKRVHNPNNFIRQCAELNKKYVYVYGGTCFDQADSGGFERVALGYPQATREAVVSAVADNLIRRRHDWTVCQFIFMQIDGVNTFRLVVDYRQQVTTAELDPDITAHFRRMWEKVDPTQSISTGWVAFPQDQANYEDVLQSILAQFEAAGAWDRERIAAKQEIRKLSRLVG